MSLTGRVPSVPPFCALVTAIWPTVTSRVTSGSAPSLADPPAIEARTEREQRDGPRSIGPPIGIDGVDRCFPRSRSVARPAPARLGSRPSSWARDGALAASGGGRCGRQLDRRSFEQPDPHRRGLLAERRPRRRRVIIHDDIRRTVRCPAENIRASAIGSCDGDERTPRVVLPASVQPDALEILVKPPQHVVYVARPVETRWHDQILGARRAPRGQSR